MLLAAALLVISGAKGLNSCLDPTDTVKYKCSPGTTTILFSSCDDLVDADLPYLQECFDSAGRSEITDIYLDWNSAFTVFPVGMFKDLPALKNLVVSSPKVKTLEGGLFNDLRSSPLISLGIVFCPELTKLPPDLFKGLDNLGFVRIQRNAKLTTLPSGLFTDCNKLRVL
ncbi:unnamed protein product [Ectocarpus fasciculatus]